MTVSIFVPNLLFDEKTDLIVDDEGSEGSEGSDSD